MKQDNSFKVQAKQQIFVCSNTFVLISSIKRRNSFKEMWFEVWKFFFRVFECR